MSVLDKVRSWIDGDSSERVLEQAARDAQVKPRSQAEAFIVKIAREVEAVMQNELVPLPQGTAIIPTEYVIFLSSEDDKEWQGVKRRGLEQGLYHILAERAKEIAGKKKLETKSFAVELRVDGTLEKDAIRVQHGWDDGSNASKTEILSRKKVPEAFTNHKTEVDTVPPGYQNPIPPAPNFAPTATGNFNAPPTVPNINFQNAPQVAPLSGNDDEATQVSTRKTELYRLEIWHNNVRQSVMPIYQNQITVGRGSKSKPVDVALSGDPEISRQHLLIYSDGQNNFSIINEGRNPAIINNAELPMGQRVAVSSGVPIAVGNYILRIQAQ